MKKFKLMVLCLFVTIIPLSKNVQAVEQIEYKSFLELRSEILSAPKQKIMDKKITYYDIPLSNKLQDFIINQAKYMSVPHELVLAVIEVESNFDADVISITNDYGLMQINKINHEWLSEIYGIENYLDPESNIIAGIHILSWLYNTYNGDVHKVLMAYNMGQAGANKYWVDEIYESDYSRKVVNKLETYRGTETDS